MSAEYPWIFLHGRWVIRGHEAWAKQVLAAHLALVASTRGRAVIVPENSVRPDIFENIMGCVEGASMDNIIYSSWDAVRGEGVLLILYEPLFLKKDYPGYVAVAAFTTPGRKMHVPEGWRKARLLRVGGDEFELTTPLASMRIRVTPRGVFPAKPPSRVHAEALRLLREALIDYGELSTRDAVDVIAYSMGVPRREARRILAELSEKGYIRISSGYVVVKY